MWLIEAIKAAFRFVRNLVRYVVQGILNFVQHVVGWFKKIYNLDKERHTPFIADMNKFKDMLAQAPTKNVGIFEGVYDEVADEITHTREVDADSLDSKTKQIMGGEDLVVLS